MNKENKEKLVIYQAPNGSLELRGDIKKETIWATQKQIAEVFGIDRSVATRHIKNIFQDKELDSSVVSAKFAHTTQHGAIKGKTQTKEVEFYNLDIILAVGYRTKSSKAIQFRQWATKTLKSYISQGYTINPKMIKKNYNSFMKAVESVQALLPKGEIIKNENVLDLIKLFAVTWFSLDAYDKGEFGKNKITKKKVEITAHELVDDIFILKRTLIKKGEATDIFANERSKGSLEGIVGNVFQTFGGEDVYPGIEEKAAHLLYFVVKNHPFTDGNKRSGAFSFVWFLRKAGVLDTSRISPEALTVLTLLIAESNPKEKDKMISLVVMLLGR